MNAVAERGRGHRRGHATDLPARDQTDRSSRVTLPRVIAAEWLKFATVPGYPAAASVAPIIIAGMAAVLVAVRASDSASAAVADLPVTDLLAGLQWAQILLAMLAVVVVCAEWSTGTSRVTFLAVPARWPVLVAKAAVVGPIALVAGALGAAGALAIGMLGDFDVAADPAFALRLIGASALITCTLAVVSLGIAAVVRDLVPSMLTTIGLLWVLPLAAAFLPWEAVHRVIAYLPAQAGGALISVDGGPTGLTPEASAALLIGWMLAALITGIVTLRSRDV